MISRISSCEFSIILSRQSDLSELLSDEPELFANQSELLAHQPELLSDEPQLLAHEPELQSNLAKLQVNPITSCDGRSLIVVQQSDLAELLAHEPELLTHESKLQVSLVDAGSHNSRTAFFRPVRHHRATHPQVRVTGELPVHADMTLHLISLT